MCLVGSWRILLTEGRKRNQDYNFNCLSKMHLDLDTNYPYLISFYHDRVWCLAVTRPGRDCLCVAPRPPDSSEARSIPSSVQPGRVLPRPGLGAGQPPSEAINLQSTESLRPSPPSRLQCPGNCLSYLDLYKSANYFIT